MMDDPFDNLSFEEAIHPANWTEETRLHTPTFEALLKPDGTLSLSGPALAEGFSVSDAQALTRFLSEQVKLPPVEPLYNFEDFAPKQAGRGVTRMIEHPPYEVTNYQQERTWRKWTYDATDKQLLAALRGAGASMESVPARECADELTNRGYTIIGVYPHEVTLEKPEGQPVGWSQDFDEEE